MCPPACQHRDPTVLARAHNSYRSLHNTSLEFTRSPSPSPRFLIKIKSWGRKHPVSSPQTVRWTECDWKWNLKLYHESKWLSGKTFFKDCFSLFCWSFMTVGEHFFHRANHQSIPDQFCGKIWAFCGFLDFRHQWFSKTWLILHFHKRTRNSI